MLPGQRLVLHERTKMLLPGHVDPPFLGGGLVHVLTVRCDPPPQLLEQELHRRQRDQPPLTKVKQQQRYKQQLRKMLPCSFLLSPLTR